jgi:hypothetical protein
MSRGRMYIAGSALAAVAVGASLALFASGAGASASTIGYEVDNGTTWTLSNSPANLSAPAASATYGDAGVVVDLGPASAYSGAPVVGSNNLAENIWLGDNPEASADGTHQLSDPVQFSYGPIDQTFWTGPQASKPSTVDYIRTLGNTEVYAWVGVVSNGTTSVSGVVNSVNGQNTSHRAVSVTVKNGVLTAQVK